jgi:hypothetical protein
MKKTLLTLVVALATVASIQAQGRFQFSNFAPGVDAPILDQFGAPIVDTTGNYRATAAFVAGGGMTIDSSVPSISGLSSFFVGFNGYFAPQEGVISTVGAGQVVTLVIRAWDFRTGATWETAGDRGQSNPFNYTLVASGTPPPGPVGLTGFQVVPIPEPSTFALAGLGVAALLVLRRRKS